MHHAQAAAPVTGGQAGRPGKPTYTRRHRCRPFGRRRQEDAMGRTPMSFDQYYLHYLGLHRTRGCRLLHAAGLVAAAALLGFICWSGRWWALALLPMTVYACAWAGHALFE